MAIFGWLVCIAILAFSTFVTVLSAWFYFTCGTITSSTGDKLFATICLGVLLFSWVFIIDSSPFTIGLK